MDEKDPIVEFFGSMFTNLVTAYCINSYDDLIAYNRAVISSIKNNLTSHLLAILANENYINLLNQLHKITVSLPKGRDEIYDYITMIEAEDGNPITGIVTFKFDIYFEKQMIFTGNAALIYNGKKRYNKLNIDSELLNKKFFIDDKYNVKDFLINETEYRDKAINKNSMLDTLNSALVLLVEPEYIREIMNRNVFCYWEDDEND